MDYIIIIIVLIVLTLILAYIYNYNLNKLKKTAIQEENKYDKIVKKYPSNIEICKDMLNRLNNNNVKVEEDTNIENCLYIAISNKILIANIKNSYTRIQTIAHECLHSVQDRKILLFNFIFSNIYLIFFILTVILGLIKKVPSKNLFLSIFIILSYIYYYVRSYLEDDAMIKARYLSEEYLKETNISNEEQIKQILLSYDKINEKGIKCTNFNLFFSTILKILIISVVFTIR